MPRPGDTLVLPENDYRYGVGPVVARVTAVLARVAYHGEPWWHLEADTANGTPDNHGGWERRELYVREASLPTTGRGARVP